MNIAGQKKRGKPRSLLLVAATAVSIIVLMACSYNHHTSTDAPKEYRTKTGKTIIILETHPVGQSLSTIEVRTEGFEHNFGEVFEDRDPVTDVFTTDLDGNGFDEIYIVTGVPHPE